MNDTQQIVTVEPSLQRGGTMIVTNPFSAGLWTREQIDRVSSGWWMLLIIGMISVVAGGIILFTDWTIGDLAAFVGAVFVVRGVFTMLSVPVDGSMRAWSVALGLIEVAVGVAVWTWPGPTLLVLALFIGWYVLFSGVTTIAGAISGRDVLPYWGLTLSLGILETLFSFWLLARPGLTLVAAILAIGFWSMFYGVVQIILAFEVKNMSARADNVSNDINSMTSSRPLDSA
jgi:uncharacterized membrane protein HdeD (DUF308 family)